MRRRGTIDNVEFALQGWSIYHLAYKYRLTWSRGLDDETELVYVDNMRQLKDAIKEKTLGLYRYEED